MSSFSIGQMNQLGDAIEIKGGTSHELTQLGQNRNEILDGLIGVLRGTHKIVAVPKVVEPAKEVNIYLRRLHTFTLGSQSGKDTYTTALKVFKAGLDTDFELFGVVLSGVAPKMEMASDELIQNGKFSEFLGNTAAELEKRRIFGSQFLGICREKAYELRAGGCANFTVLTRNDEVVAEDLSNVFVAYVIAHDSGGLAAGVREFSDGLVCLGNLGQRIFSPQL